MGGPLSLLNMKVLDLRSQINEAQNFVSELQEKEIVMWLSKQGEVVFIQGELPDGGSLYRFTSAQNIETFIVIQDGSISLFDVKI
ncbi:hypothetical protein [Aliikangiella coralliicola]|uniref:Uncharacterized protein n=1 Tax=Aliikangiella coralliicola TaxID=2592383 RepID=A0A545UC94_9GAMM|nr:hypothetical protein [Aliikangiella coralliicola]TQV87084.1 hypothetical protein FLL46_14865 [Aliikangiella coralliicola]